MQSSKFVVGNKKVLQAHVDGAILGQSATQLFTYEVFLWRVLIIITTNNWNILSFCPEDQDWIAANCISVLVDSPVWLSGDQAVTESDDAHRLQAPAAAIGSESPSTPRKRNAEARTPIASLEHKAHALACELCGQRLPQKNVHRQLLGQIWVR